jgi:pimeloyl-ACP methyl ester carboxylesterase
MSLPWLRRRGTTPLHVSIDAGSGPVVVLIHGIASSSTTFQNLIPLIESTHRVVAIDLLGFGQSVAPDSARFTIEEHVDAVAEVISRLKLRGPFVLVGHSMGALIAARYASVSPRRVSKLILVSPPIYLPATLISDPLQRTAAGLYVRAYDYLRSNRSFTIPAAAVLASMSPIKHVLDVNAKNWRAFALSLEHSIESQTALSDIASVRAPIDLIYGSLDPFLMPSGLRIVEGLRNVQVHRIEGGDHLIRRRTARVIAAAIG